MSCNWLYRSGGGRWRKRRVRRSRSRRPLSPGEVGLDELAHLDHGLAVFVVRLGVERRVARDLPARLEVVVDAPEIVAVRHRGERSVQRQNLETVPRQVQLADDLGPQQRDDVGRDGKMEAREDLFGDRRSAQDVSPLEHENLATRSREVGRVNETVVPTPDDDDVVRFSHGALGKRPSILIISARDNRRNGVPVGTAVHEETFALCESLNYRDWSGYFAVSAYETHHEHEYNAIRNAAALIDVSPLYKYRVSGRDAAKLVDRIITRDVQKLAIGQVYYTPWCDEDGKVID